MKRRHFFNVLGAAAIWPSIAWAQRSAPPLIGLLVPGSANDSKRFMTGFFPG